MAAHKPMEKKRKKMMYGRTPMEGGGMYGMKRKKKTHGGPHKNMDRIGMAMGGPNVMEVQKPN